MGCTPAPACKAAREQATRLAPRRSQASDGICSSLDHRKRSPNSDHDYGNAVDLTHDPDGGFDAHAHVEAIKQRRDPRVKYIISNRRIWNPSISNAWRAYTGSNPHIQHAHISIHSTARNDTSPWFGTVEIANEEEDMTGEQSKKLDDLHRGLADHRTEVGERLDRIEKRQGELKDGRDAILVELRQHVDDKLDAVLAKLDGS